MTQHIPSIRSASHAGAAEQQYLAPPLLRRNVLSIGQLCVASAVGCTVDGSIVDFVDGPDVGYRDWFGARVGTGLRTGAGVATGLRTGAGAATGVASGLGVTTWATVAVLKKIDNPTYI